MKRLRDITLGCAVLLAGCAAPQTQVILLPQSDGRPSAVVLRGAQGEQLLDQPYQRARIAPDGQGAFRVDQTDAQAVQAAYPQLLALHPVPPKRYTLFFASGDARLNAEAEAALDQALQAARDDPGTTIVVTGHTDTRGDPAGNDALSLARAAEVRQMLVDRGVPAARVEAAGRGARDLAIPTADQVDEPRNRRVTLEVR